VIGVGTDCCKNRQICTNKYWNRNTQEKRRIGVCEYGDIDVDARVKIYA